MTTLLAIDTALGALSVALIEDGAVRAARAVPLGRGHAEALVPMVAELLAAAGTDRADAVVVTVGPGSFTGLRVGVAAARAFGLAWDVPVTGMTATALVAAAAFKARPDLSQVAAIVDVGRGQLCAERFVRGDWPAPGDWTAAPPAALAPGLAGVALAGPGAPALAAQGAGPVASDRAPDAADAALLPPAARALPPLPRYIRPPDAVLPL